MDRLRPSREYTQGAMADKKPFLNTKSIVKVETGVVTRFHAFKFSDGYKSTMD
jgi:hypothetical protein